MCNNTIYTACINDGYCLIINAANKNSLTTIKEFQTLPNPFTHNTDLTVDDNYIPTTDETSSPPDGNKVMSWLRSWSIVKEVHWQEDLLAILEPMRQEG